MKINHLNYGVKISKLDLQSCSISDLKNLIETCIKERLVVLKNQNLSIERFNEINEVFGIHQPANIWASHADFSKIIRVTNKYVLEGKKGMFSDSDIVLDWHVNGIFSPDPEDCICLWCITPGINGLTEFACGVHAYNQLDDSIKEEIQSIRILITNEIKKTYLKKSVLKLNLPHEQRDFDKMSKRTRFFTGGSEDNPYDDQKTYINTERKDLPNGLKRKKDIEKDLVTKHSLNNITGLYFPFLNISKFIGGGVKIAPTIFDTLLNSYVGNKGKTYKHHWEKGDIILSDQTHSLHRRLPFKGVRELYRTAFWYQS